MAFEISYDANKGGSSIIMWSETALDSGGTHTFTLRTIEYIQEQGASYFQKQGYAFKEWNTNYDGSGTSYMPGDDYTVLADTDNYIYAIWEAVEYITDSDDLASVAAAIRAKGGTSSSLSFPAGFVSAIEDIPTGGAEDEIIARTISVYENSRVTTIGPYAFYSYSNLTTISFPACTTIGIYAFNYCENLTSISFPVCTTIEKNGLCNCKKLMNADFPVCTSIGSNGLDGCTSLTTANFPVCTYLGDFAFEACTNLTNISFPVCTTIEAYVFYQCSSLTIASFPVCTAIGTYAFYLCTELTTASFPVCTTIGSYAFARCYNLTSLYIMNSSIVSLPYSNAFKYTPIAGSTTSTGGVYGSIFVPSSLLTSYKTATNWSDYSSRFVGI